VNEFMTTKIQIYPKTHLLIINYLQLVTQQNPAKPSRKSQKSAKPSKSGNRHLVY